MNEEGTSGIYFGSPQEAWNSASALSSRINVVPVSKPYQRALSVTPRHYADIWTATKGFCEVEPAVADGGEVVIFAPHITEISYSHGALLDQIGYHCRDYFLKQWERFKGYSGTVLSHSTFLKGVGTYDASTGLETPRIQVTLATAIPEARCCKVNLGYRDPATIRLAEWEGREADGVFVVPSAGERAYRLR